MLHDNRKKNLLALLPFIIAIGQLILSSPVIFASWIAVPLDTVIKRSPVVVIGTVDSIKTALPLDSKYEFEDDSAQLTVIWNRGYPVEGMVYDTAYISVSEVLKNTLPDVEIEVGDIIRLSMPSETDNVGSSNDIYYNKGTTGIWILDWCHDTFWATYPKDLQPLSAQQQVRDIIDKLNLII